MGLDVCVSVKYSIHMSKHNINGFSELCDRNRHWCLRERGGICSCPLDRATESRPLSMALPFRPLTYVDIIHWQDDVNAEVGEAWQVTHFCDILVAGPSCSTEPSVSKTCTRDMYTLWQWCQGRQQSGSNGAIKVQLTEPQQKNVDTSL